MPPLLSSEMCVAYTNPQTSSIYVSGPPLGTGFPRPRSLGIQVNGIGTNILLMRPRHGSIFSSNSPKVGNITKLLKHADIQQWSAIVGPLLAIAKGDPQPVIGSGLHCFDSRVHVLASAVRSCKVAGPKALRSPSPGYRPGDRGRHHIGCRPNGPIVRRSAMGTVGPLGRSHVNTKYSPFPPGVALGWVNWCPFGAKEQNVSLSLPLPEPREELPPIARLFVVDVLRPRVPE